MARPGWCGVGAGGGEGAGGVGTHWQPLNTLKTPRKCKPGVSSGEAGVEWVWAVGVVRARGGVWARSGSL